MARVRLVVILLAFALFALAGCVPKQTTETGNPGINEYEQVFMEEMEAFIVCMDNRDAEGMKALMAPGAVKEDKDMDAQIERLLQYYEGTSTMNTLVEALESGSAERKSASRGVISREISDWFYVYTDKGTYVCYATVCQRDDTGERGEGIVFFSLMTEEVLVVDNAKFPSDPGINVLEDMEGEYHIRKAGGRSRIFEEYDREIKLADVEVWLADNDNMSAFRSTFGEPNVDEGYHAIYELQKEEGECRFISVFIEEDTDTIWKVNLMNEHSFSRTTIYPVEESKETGEKSGFIAGMPGVCQSGMYADDRFL